MLALAWAAIRRSVRPAIAIQPTILPPHDHLPDVPLFPIGALLWPKTSDLPSDSDAVGSARQPGVSIAGASAKRLPRRISRSSLASTSGSVLPAASHARR